MTGDLSGRVVLVTGATDGLGRGLAAALRRQGAEVLVHGRDPERIAATVGDLGGGPHVRSYRADFSSLDEVRGLAQEVLACEPRLHVLVNNAGIGASVPGGRARLESADGLELRFAVNYLAGYLLTRELLGRLRDSAPARIVNVSSAGQMALDFADLMLERDYSGVRAYCQSKLAQILFTIDLAERLRGEQITVNALHPATYMPTKIVTAAPRSELREGVEATLRLIADPALDGVSGRWFWGLDETDPDPQAFDPAARERLRAVSEELVA